jgi:hypothetical protein
MKITNTSAPLIFIFLLAVACYKEKNFDDDNRDLQNLFTLTADRETVAADGASQIWLTDFSNKLQTISTPIPLVENNGKLVRTVSVPLTSALVQDSVNVTATIKGVSQKLRLFFSNALPSDIQIKPGAVYVKASYTSPILIDVQLLRDTGIVSLKSLIDFSALADDGREVGAFQQYNNKSDSNGRCSFIYFFTDTLYKGDIKLRASFQANSIHLNDLFNLHTY